MSFKTNIKQVQSVGRTIGKFHKILESFPLDSDTKIEDSMYSIVQKDRIVLWDSLSIENKKLLKEWNLYDIAEEYVEISRTVFTNYLNKIDWTYLELNLPKSIIHRDLSPEHIFFINDEVSGIIDFGGARLSRRIDDISRIIAEFSNNDPTFTEEILKSYQVYIVLDELEKKFMKEIILLGYIRGGFWLLGKALQEKDDLSSYPISLKQALIDNTDSMKQMINMDIGALFNH